MKSYRLTSHSHRGSIAFPCLAVLSILVYAQPAKAIQSEDPNALLHAAFANPPDDAKIMMRWWWFGPSVEDSELKHEIDQMKEAGIGGVEVATLYPLSLDDQEKGIRNQKFLSEEHLNHLRFAADQLHQAGMRLDVTLGSGWPFGGPNIPIEQAAGKLRLEMTQVQPGETSVPFPVLEAGEKAVAVFLVNGRGVMADLGHAKLIPFVADRRIELPGVSTSAQTVICFISSRTGMTVKRPADGASGFVLDHYDQKAIATHLQSVGEKLLSALNEHPPYAVFSDSLEDYGSDWTPDLIAEFKKRRGYDITPYLCQLIGEADSETAPVRHDWGQTLTELAEENFLQPMQDWARSHHTFLRSQTYGFPPVTLSSNRIVDLPEGEGKATTEMWRQFSDTRWAASAGHLFGHNIVSSETWTWLHSPAFRATPLDLKAEADLHFLQGINQLVGHGWPYSPPSEGEPGWSMYAAGAFNAHNPWFNVMPDVTRYLQRVSFALRLGKPVNDVAVLLPNDDVWASFRATEPKSSSPVSIGGFDETGSNVSIDESMPAFLGDKLIPQILDAGFNFDFIDADAIRSVGIPYKVLILPNVDRIPIGVFQKIAEFAKSGGIVLATRRLPSTAPGVNEAAQESLQIQSLSKELFQGAASVHFIQDETQLGSLLARSLHPDVVLSSAHGKIGFTHRHLDSGDLYFLVNVTNRPQSVHASFRTEAKHGEAWDPFAGTISGTSTPGDVNLELAPYESRLLFFSDQSQPLAKEKSTAEVRKIDLSAGWQLMFKDRSKSQNQPKLTSWTDDPSRKYFSGRATYSRDLSLPETEIDKHFDSILDFGEGVPEEIPDPLPRNSMRAYIQSPVREGARVFVDDQLAGYVWHPPYRIAIGRYLHAGENHLRIEVGNTAINELADKSLPSYRLLYSRFGVEFIPQDMHELTPLPSGILHGINLQIVKYP